VYFEYGSVLFARKGDLSIVSLTEYLNGSCRAEFPQI
jgi:hypothetical protein